MTKQLSLVFIVFVSLVSFGQDVKVCGIKARYKKGESIVFTVINRKNTLLYLSSFVLDKYNPNNKEWDEQVHDILNADCGQLLGKEGFILEVDSLRKIIWNPKMVENSCFDYKSNYGKYRLSFKYSLSLNAKNKYYLKYFYIDK